MMSASPHPARVIPSLRLEPVTFNSSILDALAEKCLSTTVSDDPVASRACVSFADFIFSYMHDVSPEQPSRGNV